MNSYYIFLSRNEFNVPEAIEVRLINYPIMLLHFSARFPTPKGNNISKPSEFLS